MSERFELLERVGEGGMGTVFRARDRTTGEIVAVKQLRDLRANDLARFEQEATHLSRLDHPAVIRYIDHGTAADGLPYLAMAWVDGITLRERMTRAPLTIDETITVLRRIAAALGAAHAQGVVHRDVKPSNVLCPDGRLDRATLIDFGVARRADALHGLTRTGVIVGSPGYFSPEQARADGVIDARADVFGLGCLAYECLAGRTPFGGEHVMAVRLRVLMSEPIPLARFAPHVPDALAALITRMLAKRADGRPADGAVVADALAALAAPAASAASGAQTQEPASADAPAPDRWPELAGAYVILASPDEPATEPSAGSAPLARVADGFGASAEMMNDGTFLVTIGTGDDAAVRAASCALALRRELPDVTMRVARLPSADVGAAIERQVGALLAGTMRGIFEQDEDTPGGPIFVDPGVVDALATGFDLGAAGVQRVLRGRRGDGDV